MATNTPNYDLVKPTYTDACDIQQLNENADKIDAALKKLTDEKLAVSALNNMVVNNLEQTTPGSLLDAAQGKVLKDLLNTCLQISSIYNGLDGTDDKKALGAPQGKALNELIAAKAGKPITFSITFLATGWSASAPYTQTLVASDLLATDVPWADVVLSATPQTAIQQLINYSKISSVEALESSVKATCLEAKPTADVTIRLVVIR